MIETIILSKDEHFASDLELQVKELSSRFNVNQVFSCEEILLRELDCQLAFVDLEHLSEACLDQLSTIKEYGVDLILLAPSVDFAYRAIQLRVVDYLLKPVKKEDLKAALTQFISMKYRHELKSTFDHLMRRPPRKDRIIIPEQEGLQVVNLAMTSHIEADRNYSIFHMHNLDQVVSSKPIGEYEILLSQANFLRIHRSHCINLDYLKSYSRRNGKVLLTNGVELTVSRSRKDSMLKYIQHDYVPY